MGHNLTDQVAASARGKMILGQERLILEVTEMICETMEEAGISRTELADRLGKSKGHVSQLLDGSRNMTLRTLADIFTVLEKQFEMRLDSPRRTTVQRGQIVLPDRQPLWCVSKAVQEPCCFEDQLSGQVA